MAAKNSAEGRRGFARIEIIGAGRSIADRRAYVDELSEVPAACALVKHGAGRFTEGNAELDSGHRLDQQFMNVVDGLDENGLAEDEIDVVGIVDGDVNSISLVPDGSVTRKVHGRSANYRSTMPIPLNHQRESATPAPASAERPSRRHCQATNDQPPTCRGSTWR